MGKDNGKSKLEQNNSALTTTINYCSQAIKKDTE
jgi:hypothetical protein